jgi:hypothetical protein
MMRTPDGHGRLELNVVDNIDDIIARLFGAAPVAPAYWG